MHSGEVADPVPDAPKFLGHPRLVWMLFAIGISANFAFYGFRAFLAPYAADTFFAHLPHAEGLAQATLLFSAFGSLNFSLAILGGWVADKVLGEVQSLRLSLWLCIAGLVAMAVPNERIFLLGLGFFVLATGLGIPLTVLIGRNYAANGAKREMGYTLYYEAINIGAFFAPIICADVVARHYGYRFGFLAAAAVEFLGAVLFEWKHRRVIGPPSHPRYQRAWSTPVVIVVAVLLSAPAAFMLAHPDVTTWFIVLLFLALLAYFIIRSARRHDRVQSHRYIALLILFVALVLYWAMSLQSATALNFFARDWVAPLWHGQQLGIPWSFTVFQSANPLYIIILGTFVGLLWLWLDKHHINPVTPRKFGIGLFLIAIGYGFLWYATTRMLLPDGKVVGWALLLYYFLATMGELALSPIGYGLIGKLVAPEDSSLAMGGWFFGVAVSANLAGRIATHTTTGGIEPYAHVFQWLFIVGLAIAVIYLIATPWILKLMHGVR